MRILKRHPLLKPGTNYVIDAPQPANISYWWNVGSLLGLSLGIQIITGVTLAMHYNPSVLEAFNSVEHIMRDVNNGWLIRYLHSNIASAFFFLVYLHIGRGLYYGSYKSPRTLVWTIGTVIFILMIATAFLGYVLPYGQMSLWGATVITNLMSAIPWIGQDIVEFVWGGFSVNNATLNRFFSLHFLLPFMLAGLALLHLISLHDSAASGNPLGTSGNYDRVPFAPYFIFKDIITIFIFMFLVSMFAFFVPNALGDSENYVMANPMQTPPAIVPEWYLLPFYAILRSIPDKLVGVICMFSAILIILAMALTDISKSRGMQHKPLNKGVFFTFVGILLLLMVLGAKHVESPFIEIGQIGTLIYFAYYSLTVPGGGLFEISFSEFQSNLKDKSYLLLNKILDEKFYLGKSYSFVSLNLKSVIPYIDPNLIRELQHSTAECLDAHSLCDTFLRNNLYSPSRTPLSEWDLFIKYPDQQNILWEGYHNIQSGHNAITRYDHPAPVWNTEFQRPIAYGDFFYCKFINQSESHIVRPLTNDSVRQVLTDQQQFKQSIFNHPLWEDVKRKMIFRSKL